MNTAYSSTSYISSGLDAVLFGVEFFFSCLRHLCLYSPLQNNGEEKWAAVLNVMKISLLCRSSKISNVLRGLAADRRKDGAIGLKCQYTLDVHLAIGNQEDPSSTCIL